MINIICSKRSRLYPQAIVTIGADAPVARMFVRLLENAKVALVPGDVFGTEGDHYVRMSFANSYENVVEGCKRLKEFVEKLRRNK